MRLLALLLKAAFVVSFFCVAAEAQERHIRHRGESVIVMQAGRGDPIRALNDKIKADIAGAAVDKSATAINNIATALAKPFKDIADFIGSDADGAVVLATVIPALQDGHGQQCWIAMQSFGDVIKAHPVPITFHVLQDYETLRLLGMATNNLCANTHCTQVFADLTSMATAASPMLLAIPSLHDLCTKVPQIASIPGVTITPIPSPAPSPIQGNPALGAGPTIPATTPTPSPAPQ